MGENDVGIFCYVLAAICGIFAVIAAACIVISLRRHARTDDQWKARVAKESGYTVRDIDEFERQALEMESRVITLLDPARKALAGQEGGVITRDYLYLIVGSDYLIKLSDLRVACLYKQSIRVGESHQAIDYLCVGLITKGGQVSAVAECTKASGRALIDYLKERCPDLDTEDDEILESGDYNERWAEERKKA